MVVVVSSKFKIRLFEIISIVFLCVGVTIKSFQNDTFYIIKVGEYIVKHGIDLKDHWCWITKLSYTYPHWLYDVIVYFIYSNFGNLGVYVSTIIFFIILILTIYVIHLKLHKNEFLALFVSLLSIPCLYGFATARAQLLTIILFLLEVYFIEKLIMTGMKRFIIFLTLVSLLVANLHATIWVFYFILYLPFLCEHLFYYLRQSRFFQKFYPLKRDSKVLIEKILHIKELCISFMLGASMGMLTPSKICYTYIFRIMMGNSQKFIIEHSPLIVIQHPCFIVFILTVLLILIFTKTRIKLRELFMICGLILMSLVSGRHIIFFYSIGVLYLSILVCRYLYDSGDKTLDVLIYFIEKNRIVYLFLIIIVMLVSYFQFQKSFAYDYVPKKDYPVDAVSFMHNNLNIDELKLYNDYGVGSYLMFQDIPVFIDSRCDLYLSEFNGLDYSIFDDVMEIAYNYEKKFDFYGVTHALVSKSSLFYKILLKDENYNIIYKDKNFVLFERV